MGTRATIVLVAAVAVGCGRTALQCDRHDAGTAQIDSGEVVDSGPPPPTIHEARPRPTLAEVSFLGAIDRGEEDVELLWDLVVAPGIDPELVDVAPVIAFTGFDETLFRVQREDRTLRVSLRVSNLDRYSRRVFTNSAISLRIRPPSGRGWVTGERRLALSNNYEVGLPREPTLEGSIVLELRGRPAVPRNERGDWLVEAGDYEVQYRAHNRSELEGMVTIEASSGNTSLVRGSPTAVSVPPRSFRDFSVWLRFLPEPSCPLCLRVRTILAGASEREYDDEHTIRAQPLADYLN